MLFKQYSSGMTVPSDRVADGLVSIPDAHQKVGVFWERDTGEGVALGVLIAKGVVCTQWFVE